VESVSSPLFGPTGSDTHVTTCVSCSFTGFLVQLKLSFKFSRMVHNT
jgi:hypothetical protein